MIQTLEQSIDYLSDNLSSIIGEARTGDIDAKSVVRTYSLYLITKDHPKMQELLIQSVRSYAEEGENET